MVRFVVFCVVIGLATRRVSSFVNLGSLRKRLHAVRAIEICYENADYKEVALETVQVMKEWGLTVDSVCTDFEDAIKRVGDEEESGLLLLSSDPAVESRKHCSIIRLPTIIAGLDQEKVRYFFQRAKSGRSTVPLPYEWREAPLSLASVHEIALLSGHALRKAIEGQGSTFDAACLQNTYTLPQIARAVAVLADLETLRTPLFSIDTQYLERLAFPLTADDFRVPTDDDLSAVNELLSRTPAAPSGSRAFGKRKTQQQIDFEEDLADHAHLVSTLAPIFDHFALDEDLAFEDDDALLLDGNALFGSVVYKNDKYHRQLGAPRLDILPPSSDE